MVSNARLDLPLPLGPVTTVNLPSGRSRSMPLRLFWRAPRISMQPTAAGGFMRFFSTAFKPTGDNSRCQPRSQISQCQKQNSVGKAVRFVRAGLAFGTLTATPTVRSVLLDVRAASLTLPGQRRLTNRKTSRARRSLFAIPHDQYPGSRPRIYALHRVRQDRDRE